jgi:cyclic-di-GMP phosphodiesterase, flagellum assembly factor TipF
MDTGPWTLESIRPAIRAAARSRQGKTGFGMVRISAIFIAVCMVLIAASLAVVVYLRFGFTGAEAALVGFGGLMALAVYNVISSRLRERAQASAQISTLSRNSGDLARQLGEFGLRLNAMEGRVEQVLQRTLETAQPLAAELEELSSLVKQLADSVAAHEIALAEMRNSRQAAADVHASATARPAAQIEPSVPFAATPAPAASAALAAAAVPVRAPEAAPAFVAPPSVAPAPVAPAERTIPAFAGLGRDGIISLIRQAVDGGKIDLYLQPIVMLPQRKVRFYEALSRLKAENGDMVAAGDFLKYAEAGSLVPKLDHLTVLRCVQVVRRLLLKNRDIGLFCNISGARIRRSQSRHRTVPGVRV